MKTGSESIEAIMRKRRILFTVFVAHMEDTRLPECVMFGDLVGGTGCVGAGKRADVVFPERLQSFQYQCLPVDDCSPGQGELLQDGRTRGKKFDDKMDRCRESHSWSTACCCMLKYNEKDQGEDIAHKASLLVLVRSS